MYNVQAMQLLLSMSSETTEKENHLLVSDNKPGQLALLEFTLCLYVLFLKLKHYYNTNGASLTCRLWRPIPQKWSRITKI